MAIQVFLLDGLTQIAEVTAFEAVEAIENDMAKGTWMIRIARSAAPAVTEEALRAQWLGIEIVDTETGWRYGGPCTKRIRTYTRTSSRDRNELTVELRGVDAMDYLDALLEWPNTTDVALWWQTVTGTLVLSTAVTNGLFFQGGPGALVARQIPNLEIITPTPFGPSKTWNATGLPLQELYRPWYNATDWTYRLVLWRSDTDDAASLRFTTTQRAVAAEIITPTLQDSIVVTETAASATFVAAMGEQIAGQPDGVRRALGATTPSTNWLTRRREIFINRPSSTLASLQTEADDALELGLPKITAEIEDFEMVGYGLTVQLGDLVQVNYDPDEATLALPIVSSRLIGSPTEGWRRTVSVGNENLIGPRQIASNIGEIAKRLRRLETQVQV